MKHNEKIPTIVTDGIEKGQYDVRRDPRRGGILYKSELARRYFVSTRTLYKFLDIVYYEELEKLGYKKKSKILNPRVVNFFLFRWIRED